MSKGPGVWQQRILAALETMTPHQIHWVIDIVHEHVPAPTRADYVAARRATRRLVELGKIRAGMFRYHDGTQARDSLAFTRPDSLVESNIYHGMTNTPSWHNTVPAKYAHLPNEWNPRMVTRVD